MQKGLEVVVCPGAGSKEDTLQAEDLKLIIKWIKVNLLFIIIWTKQSKKQWYLCYHLKWITSKDTIAQGTLLNKYVITQMGKEFEIKNRYKYMHLNHFAVHWNQHIINQRYSG